MKNTLQKTLMLSTLLMMPLAFSVGCSHEISRSESDKPNWSGGRTQEETVVTRNADGTTSTSHEKQVTNP